MKHMKALVIKYKYVIPALVYLLIYLVWFAYLEQTVTKNYNVIHMAIDDYIPFCEIFIVPYYLWFLYVAVVFIFVSLTDKAEFHRVCLFMFTGMTVFLVISTLWPNGQHLRPYIMPRDNIFTRMVTGLYRTDTPTNIWPSIHVYNSLAAHIAVMKSARLARCRKLRIASLMLAISIILSTVFLKQHSVFDVLTAFGLGLVMYAVVYKKQAIAAFVQMLKGKRKSSLQTD